MQTLSKKQIQERVKGVFKNNPGANKILATQDGQCWLEGFDNLAQDYARKQGLTVQTYTRSEVMGNEDNEPKSTDQGNEPEQPENTGQENEGNEPESTDQVNEPEQPENTGQENDGNEPESTDEGNEPETNQEENDGEIQKQSEKEVLKQRAEEAIKKGLETKVLHKAGTWIKFGDDGLAQGHDNTVEYLVNNPDYLAKIEETIDNPGAKAHKK